MYSIKNTINKILTNKNTYQWSIAIIFIIAVVSRVIFFGKYPVGLHADEAYAGYEAWSMYHYGYDSWGYKNPVYLMAWGSGMNALNSYLMLPFIAIGGLSPATLRMPQLIMGIITLIVFYLLLKKISTPQVAFWGFFLLAISPWHIMMNRWGIESNLAPAFILLGIYFGVLGLEKEKYLLLSALFWGLSLYCYAVIWFFVPTFILISGVILFKHKKIRISKYTLLFLLILFAFALPLLLFVAVNMGLLPEIRTNFISIPKFVEFRSDEITLKNIFENAKVLFRIIIKQDDYILTDSIPYFGIYYLFSLPFVIIGAIVAVRNSICAMKEKRFVFDILLLVWLFVASAVGLLRSMNIIRINCLHLAMFILLAIGINTVSTKISRINFSRWLIIIYLFSFTIFGAYYFTVYQESISEMQFEGADEALSYASQMKEEYDKDWICITKRLRHPLVLFYTQYPTDEFIDTVKWENYPAKILSAESFGCFTWNDSTDGDNIYVISSKDASQYSELGFEVTTFKSCAVAVKPK